MDAGKSSSTKTHTGDDDEMLASSIKSKIRPDITKEILKLSFKDPKTKIHDDSLAVLTEVLRTLIMEAALRASKQAARDHRTVIDIEQIEKILPQLMLDFP